MLMLMLVLMLMLMLMLMLVFMLVLVLVLVLLLVLLLATCCSLLLLTWSCPRFAAHMSNTFCLPQSFEDAYQIPVEKMHSRSVSSLLRLLPVLLASVVLLALNGGAVYLTASAACAWLGSTVSPWFFSLLLLDIVYRSETLKVRPLESRSVGWVSVNVGWDGLGLPGVGMGWAGLGWGEIGGMDVMCELSVGTACADGGDGSRLQRKAAAPHRGLRDHSGVPVLHRGAALVSRCLRQGLLGTNGAARVCSRCVPNRR
jgi:hypothetical protein